MKTIAVAGVGTAGILSLSHFLTYLDDDWQVVSIHDPETSIVGIGESTTVSIPRSLFFGARFSLLRDADELDATLKVGIKYTGWRKHDIFSKIIPPAHGIHFNNFKLKEFAFQRFEQIWKNKFVQVIAKIESMENKKDHVKVSTDKGEYKFDYIIDCRGWPEDYSDYKISATGALNHALVHTVNEPGDWNYTHHMAHRNGWMFGIPLKTRQGWGYLYNDNITQKEDALDDISERFKIKKQDLNLKEFTFKNFIANKFIDGRILKNGNRAMFLEPMEALSGGFYCQVCGFLFDYIILGAKENEVNKLIVDAAEDIETFIAYIYHGGSTYESDFWTDITKRTSEHLNNSSKFQMQLNEMRQMNRFERFMESRTPFSMVNWQDFDKDFDYNYFTEKDPLKQF
jgi:hypothetical protein